MRNTYTVTYRNYNGRTTAEDLFADTYFDAAATVRLSHNLKHSDIISNVIKDGGKVGKKGRKGLESDR